MKSILLYTMLASLLLSPASVRANGSQSQSAGSKAPAVSAKLKPFLLHTIGGNETVTLESLKGKVVVLNFFFPT